MASTTRRKFAEEFKREAVGLCEQPGATVAGIARDLGVDRTVLKRWVDLAHGVRRPNAVAARSPAVDSAFEVHRLQRELRRVTMERDVLKKALGYFAKEPQ